ncbi:Zn-dependent hydrolase [Mesorhizobium sp.]|uniref:Zn-dependent hydrolase n=1 Tax=Mesorhizobium sp. TaxID=1871066 RepID=UPI000FE4DFF6|nr:Zn-dependent hydrolase [Mesorhizobium sp.]RWP16801.1 MAG: Zn-dependent hydrolase [Mesorhizobium sp.]TIM50766.1 MAG: Zn-dependent hydrolase [Mesorhizobium sp.]
MLEIRKDPSAFPDIDAEALHRMMDEVSAFGGGPDGSMTRLTLSREDGLARDWLAAWFAQEGLRLEVDAIGNMYGFLDWAGRDAPWIMCGSHLDSQPNGGRFDGAYGVIAACSAIEAIRRRVAETGFTPKCNFVIVNWTNEEGARFQPSLLGSSVNSGEIDLDFALARRDGSGVSVAEALSEIGYSGEAARVVPDALIEIHIEGSAHLEKAGLRIGAFTRFWGAVKYRLAYLGRQAHTGPTPMAERQDALLAAAYLIAELREMADKAGPDLHTSAARLEVHPNSPNVVPAEAVMFIELRSGSAELLESAEAELKQKIAACAGRANASFEVRSIDRRRAGEFDAGLIDLAEQTAKSLGQTVLRLDTIGGHDAVSMSAVTPAIVIGVPSVGGVIHHPTEFTTPEDRLLGTELLAGMLWRFCVDGNILKN